MPKRKKKEDIFDKIFIQFKDIYEDLPPYQKISGIMGAYSMLKLGGGIEEALIGFASGILAAKGLESRSEAVGISCLAVLGSFGVFTFGRTRIISEAEVKAAREKAMEEEDFWDRVAKLHDLLKKYQPSG